MSQPIVGRCCYCGKLVRQKYVVGTLHICLTPEGRVVVDEGRRMVEEQRRVIATYPGVSQHILGILNPPVPSQPRSHV